MFEPPFIGVRPFSGFAGSAMSWTVSQQRPRDAEAQKLPDHRRIAQCRGKLARLRFASTTTGSLPAIVGLKRVGTAE
jgi:hypothetical protein